MRRKQQTTGEAANSQGSPVAERHIVGVLLWYSNFALPKILPGFAGLQQPVSLHEQAVEVDPTGLATDSGQVLRSRSAPTRLNPTLCADVLARYESGQTGREIAEALGIARSTVIKIVREGGGQVRHARLTSRQCAEICRLYRVGMSQVEIAKQFQCNPSNVWHVLERGGLVGKRRS